MSDYECFDCAHVVRAELRQLREQIAEALAEVPFHMTHSDTFALAKLTESLEALLSSSTVTQPDEQP